MNKIDYHSLGYLVGANNGSTDLQADVLSFLDTMGLFTNASVSKGFNRGITVVWERIARELKYPVDEKQSSLRNYKNFINNLLLTINACPKEGVPSDILAIAERAKKKAPTVVQARKLHEFVRGIRARDTLLVWKLLADQANIEVGISKTPEISIEQADRFANWIGENQEKLNGLKKLDLSKNKLVFIPSELGMLTKLQSLCLEDNQIISVPSELGMLKSLICLDLSHNLLRAIPKELANLSKLNILFLSYNFLKDVPKELGKLKGIFHLDLSWNRLTAIPEEIKKLSGLAIHDNPCTSWRIWIESSFTER